MLRFSLASFWRPSPLCCLLSGALLLLASCGQNAGAGQTGAQPACKPDHIIGVEESLTKGYHSLTGLKQDADLGVQGLFTAVVDTTSPDSSGLVYTDFTFTITHVLWDPHHQIPGSTNSVTIHQTGGCTGGTFYKVADDPLFQIGEEAILFLHQFSSGQYFVIGGPSGRFEVRHGFVQPVNDEGVQLPPNLTEQQFYTLLQKA